MLVAYILLSIILYLFILLCRFTRDSAIIPRKDKSVKGVQNVRLSAVYTIFVR